MEVEVDIGLRVRQDDISVGSWMKPVAGTGEMESGPEKFSLTACSD